MIFKDDLIRILNDHGFEHFIKEHPPLFTVEDSKAFRGQIEGAHSKNLFLKDAKAKFFLISIHREENTDNINKAKDLIELLNAIAEKYKYPVIVSTHPRTKNMLEQINENQDTNSNHLKKNQESINKLI